MEVVSSKVLVGGHKLVQPVTKLINTDNLGVMAFTAIKPSLTITRPIIINLSSLDNLVSKVKGINIRQALVLSQVITKVVSSFKRLWGTSIYLTDLGIKV